MHLDHCGPYSFKSYCNQAIWPRTLFPKQLKITETKILRSQVCVFIKISTSQYNFNENEGNINNLTIRTHKQDYNYGENLISFVLSFLTSPKYYLGRIKRISYLSAIQAAKVQASLRIRTVSPEPPLLAHTSSEWRGTFRQKARSLAPLNGWACGVKICHDRMLEDSNSLDGAHLEVV